MSNQAELDGIRGWGSTLVQAFGSRLADNVTGTTAERQPDKNNTEEQQGQPTPGQQMAGRMQNLVGGQGFTLLVGGVVLAVAVVAIMGARK